MELLKRIDVLVDGEFMLDKKDVTLLFKGSSNQRTIDVPKSLAAGKSLPGIPEIPACLRIRRSRETCALLFYAVPAP